MHLRAHDLIPTDTFWSAFNYYILIMHSVHSVAREPLTSLQAVAVSFVFEVHRRVHEVRVQLSD